MEGSAWGLVVEEYWDEVAEWDGRGGCWVAVPSPS